MLRKIIYRTSCFKSPTRFFSSSKYQLKGLKIAFFGSDEFSIESLKGLIELSKSDEDAIDSIDVIAKHPKAVGRGLRDVGDVPIAQVAERNGLQLIRAEKNKEIIDLIPKHYTMVIAVSYGKLIPHEFLKTIPYSLNVHPSLLPRYSGASPLQFALMNNDKITGVTVQTLHPTEFDRGEIIDQTEEIPVNSDETLHSLTTRLSIVGSQLLTKVIRTKSYINPAFQPKGKYQYSYASKITPELSQIDWNSTAVEIHKKFLALGPLFTFKEILIKKRRKPTLHDWRRIILYDFVPVESLDSHLKPGEFYFKDGELYVQTGSGSIKIKSIQFEYEKIENGDVFYQRLPKRIGNTDHTFIKRE